MVKPEYLDAEKVSLLIQNNTADIFIFMMILLKLVSPIALKIFIQGPCSR
jgi:hypothetical protein